MLKFAQQFSRPGKSLGSGDKVWKNGKKYLSFFFFLSYSKYFTSEFFLVLVKSYSILSVCLQCIIEKSFVPVFFKVSIDHSVDNPESGKGNK